MTEALPKETKEELKPCRACGKPCRVERYEPARHGVTTLYLCSNSARVGGDCPDPNAYLSADAWNTRP